MREKPNCALTRFFRSIFDLWSLIVGLGVTGYNFFRPLRNVRYPRVTVGPEKLEGYRGHVELVAKPKDPTIPKCISCLMCVNACPSKCLTVVKQKAPKPTEEEQKAMKEAEERGEKVKKPKAPKNPAKFIYDYSLCSLCGTCVENCPVNSIRYSDNVYYAVSDRRQLNLDLLKRLADQAARGGSEAAAKPPKKESVKKAEAPKSEATQASEA